MKVSRRIVRAAFATTCGDELRGEFLVGFNLLGKHLTLNPLDPALGVTKDLQRDANLERRLVNSGDAAKLRGSLALAPPAAPPSCAVSERVEKQRLDGPGRTARIGVG